MRCSICTHYKNETDMCKFCKFEYNLDYTPCQDDKWDILNLDDDEEWSHIQILDRLYYKNIDCLFADIWYGSDMAFLIGVKESESVIARVLGVHQEVIYNDFEHGMMIINLFQEKYLRGILDKKNKEI